jgi:hypothetical protein
MSFVQVAVAGMNAYGQIQQGKIAKAQAGMQADSLDYQAKGEIDAATKYAAIIRRAGRKQIGATVAGYAGAGVKVGEGSAGEVEGQIQQDVEHDAFQAILDGGRRASGLQTDATMMRMQGKNAARAGMVNAVGTVLAGFANGAQANGWNTKRATPAPVETRTPVPTGWVGRDW